MSDVRVEPRSRGGRGPTGPTGPGSPGDLIPIIAAAFVNGNTGAFYTQSGFASVTRVTDGHYELVLASPPPDDLRIIPQALPRAEALSGNPVVHDVTGGMITLLTYVSNTGLLNDMDFYVTIGELPA